MMKVDKCQRLGRSGYSNPNEYFDESGRLPKNKLSEPKYFKGIIIPDIQSTSGAERKGKSTQSQEEQNI